MTIPCCKDLSPDEDCTGTPSSRLMSKLLHLVRTKETPVAAATLWVTEFLTNG